jgi:hypothetical protein
MQAATFQHLKKDQHLPTISYLRAVKVKIFFRSRKDKARKSRGKWFNSSSHTCYKLDYYLCDEETFSTGK